MNSATTQRLAELRAAGATAEQAAAALAADVVTAKDVDLKQLSGYLGTVGLDLVLQKAVNNGAYPEALRDGIQQLLNQLSWKGEVFATAANPAVAARFEQVCEALVAAGIITDDQRETVLGFAGGYRYERLTADEITQHWVALDAAAALEALRRTAGDAYNAVVAAMDNGETDRAALAAVFAAAMEA